MFCTHGYMLKRLNFLFTHFEFSSFSCYKYTYKLLRAVAYFTLRLKNYLIVCGLLHSNSLYYEQFRQYVFSFVLTVVFRRILPGC